MMALQLSHGGQIPINTAATYTVSPTPCRYLPTSVPAAAVTSGPLPPILNSAQPLQDFCKETPSIVVERLESFTESVELCCTDASSINITVEEEPMKAVKTKAIIGLLSTLISYMTLNSIFRAIYPETFIWQDEDREEPQWLGSSKYWLDRKACRWLGICGGTHMHFAGEKFGHHSHSRHDNKNTNNSADWDWQNGWTEGKDRPEDWTDDERVLREIPNYVIEYAPLVHLFSGEQFWPCDIAEHLYHITPALNYTPLQSERRHPTLENLDKLNEWQHGRWVFLTSNDNVEERPEWLEGEKNIPADPSKPDDDFKDNDGWLHYPGRTYLQVLKEAISDLKDWFAPGLHGLEQTEDFLQSSTGLFRALKEEDSFRRVYHDELKRDTRGSRRETKIRGGRSDAPAVLLTVNKGHGVVDAFWFFFYSFNLGNVVFNVRFGNHVGDWEHTAIRFHNGKPKAVFFSEHNFGSAYGYDAVEKLGKRPVIYSAIGTHAMYATPGLHPYVLPWGILHDETDRGPLWDPALNSHAYTYDFKTDTLRSSNLTPSAPTEWFHFAGHWGDKFYPLNDRRQYRFAGQYHYVNGPLGPKFKNLGRKKICGGPDSAPCVIKHWLGGGSKNGLRKGWNGDSEDGLQN